MTRVPWIDNPTFKLINTYTLSQLILKFILTFITLFFFKWILFQIISMEDLCRSDNPRKPSSIPMVRPNTPFVTTTIYRRRGRPTTIRDPNGIWVLYNCRMGPECGRGCHVKCARSWRNSFGFTRNVQSFTDGRISDRATGPAGLNRVDVTPISPVLFHPEWVAAHPKNVKSSFCVGIVSIGIRHVSANGFRCITQSSGSVRADVPPQSPLINYFFYPVILLKTNKQTK